MVLLYASKYYRSRGKTQSHNTVCKMDSKRIILINLFEDDRLHKDKMIIKGIVDGIRFHI